MVFIRVMRYRYWLAIGASIILGIIFLTSGLGKLLSQAESLENIFNPFPDFLSPVFTEAIFSWLPLIELVVGLLLITGIAGRLTAVFSLVIVVGFITNNSWLLSRGLGYESCGCFGIVESIIKVDLSTAGALYLDMAMIALVLIILFCDRSGFLNIYPWFLKRGKVD